MTTLTLNVLDFGFETAELIDNLQLRRKLNVAVNVTATVAAVVVGLASYLWVALQLFWEDHGDDIVVGATRFAFLTADFAGNVLIAGRNFRRVANFVTATLADRAYFAVVR
jgi:hypothetical protein